MLKNVINVFILSLVFVSCAADAERYDLLITNGSIIDGSGSSAFTADLLIHDGVIVEIGDINTDGMIIRREMDAEGKTITPGFIDTHSHGNPLSTPRFDNFLSMGVTTVSMGQDGGSDGLDDVNAWMNEVDEQGTGPNILYFAGHNSLRRMVDAPRESGLAESYIEEMREILIQALEAGAFGITTGLEYDHGSFADLPELIALGEPVAEANGLILSHMRNEDEDMIEESVSELLTQGIESGANVQASHIKIVFGDDPQKAESVLELMNEARDKGINVTADVYPYTASFTGISIVFPDWALPPNDFDEVVSEQREELEEYLRNRVEARNGPEATLIGTAPWAGMTLKEVAEELNKPFEDVLIDDIKPGGASAAYFVMDEDVMRRFLVDPFVMVSSDGSPTMRHPRGYGSFAKIIRQYVNEENLLSLEEAIYKMSGLPAETVGLSDSEKVETPRGLIREGFAADLLIFDPANVNDTATFEEPHTYAEGFDWVFVNGTAVIAESVRNELLPAGVIRKVN
ncbi:MAG: amidohydrolase family protein [Balneolaceae bacterium]